MCREKWAIWPQFWKLPNQAAFMGSWPLFGSIIFYSYFDLFSSYNTNIKTILPDLWGWGCWASSPRGCPTTAWTPSPRPSCPASSSWRRPRWRQPWLCRAPSDWGEVSTFPPPTLSSNLPPLHLLWQSAHPVSLLMAISWLGSTKRQSRQRQRQIQIQRQSAHPVSHLVAIKLAWMDKKTMFGNPSFYPRMTPGNQGNKKHWPRKEMRRMSWSRKYLFGREHQNKRTLMLPCWGFCHLIKLFQIS